jgi:hypothetical protein
MENFRLSLHLSVPAHFSKSGDHLEQEKHQLRSFIENTGAKYSSKSNWQANKFEDTLSAE